MPIAQFDRFYDVFLQNSLRGQRFRVTLMTGKVLEGVPTAGSIVDPMDPNITFHLRVDGEELYSIPYARVRDAVLVE